MMAVTGESAIGGSDGSRPGAPGTSAPGRDGFLDTDARLRDSVVARLREAMTAPVGDFRYGRPAGRVDLEHPEFRVPELDRTELPEAAIYLLEKAWERTPGSAEGTLRRAPGDVRDTLTVVGSVINFVKRRPIEGHNRQVLFGASIEAWQGRGMRSFVGDILELYGVRDNTRILRGGQPNGHEDNLETNVYSAYGYGGRFLLVDRAEIVDDAQVQQLIRLLEIVSVSSKESVLQVLNELSLPERLRVDGLLTRERATDEERRAVGTRATRQKVHCDEDVLRLLDEHRLALSEGPRQPGLRAAVARMVGRLAALTGTRRSGREKPQESVEPQEHRGRHYRQDSFGQERAGG